MSRTLRFGAFLSLLAVTSVGTLSCGPVRGMGDVSTVIPDGGFNTPMRAWNPCPPGQNRCFRNPAANEEIAQSCRMQGEFSTYSEIDCRAQGLSCFESISNGIVSARCVACQPNQVRCSDDASEVWQCSPEGDAYDVTRMCDVAHGEACRNGQCVNLCQDNSIANTNIGCEYYAVDLDNAVVGDGRSAASQQYAVVVSNPDPVLTARVIIEINTAPPGMPPMRRMVASAVIAPNDLETFRLPARELDCSAPGTFNTGTHTCLSSNAYHVVATIPVIAYQFNPLENSSVFSNDASLLIPTNSLNGDYIATGWPQTIATSMDPNTNFGENLRAFLTIVGTEANTRVTITPTAAVVPTGMDGPLPMGAPIGRPFTVTLGAFDVLNLESGAFGADFTGSHIEPMGGAVAVFSGSEASDSPAWTTMAERACCADHLEEQLVPRRTAASQFVMVHMPSRSRAVRAAGGPVAEVNEPQWFRLVNVGNDVASVDTTILIDPRNPDQGTLSFNLNPGAQRTLRTLQDFEVSADQPLLGSTITGSQATTGIPTDQPGGDPSMILVPPVRQWRSRYVFLTPDKYAFDFVTIAARASTHVTLDGTALPFADCPMTRADTCVDRPMMPCPPPNYVVYRCQLSFPRISPTRRAPDNVLPGRQQDGVHIVDSDDRDQGVMVIVSGFDSYVGYGYAGGTRTESIN